MILPVVPVTIDAGVPIKGVTFKFVTNINLETKSLTLDGIEYKESFAIASTTYCEEDVKKNSNQKITKGLGQIQLICNLESKTQTEGGWEVSCYPYSYAQSEEWETEEESNIYGFFVFRELIDKYPHSGMDDLEELKDLLSFVLSNTPANSTQLQMNITESKKLEEVLNILALEMYQDPFELYIYQQTLSEKERFKTILDLLLKNAGIMPISFEERERPEKKSKSKIDGLSEKDVFKMFLKEFSKQMIMSEPPLGVEDDRKPNEESIEQMPKEVFLKYQKEQKRLKRLPTSSLEYQTSLDYIELLESIPWSVYTKKELNLKTIMQNLDSTHQGLEEVKRNIMNHFALQLHTGKPSGNTLCFLGSPGTGKTSIVKSIAKATGRKLIPIALGGMTDEAEFRGHRRTYVSSKPGRIIKAITDCGVMDPIILLDEIDKITVSSRGNPLAALLEILDPEQNSEFIDRYLEVPIDLSKCLFIATANYKDKIPAPLLDRLDLVEFKDYTPEEKINILKNYTIERTKKTFKIEDFEIDHSDCFYEKIKDYTNREAEKIIKNIYKGFVYEHLVDGKTKFSVSGESIKNTSKTPKIGFK